ncbi:MAG TPA: TonB-dependent receptor [Myxococcota bacterium]|nr:TonB-dependent receptor [Myxococcota bacterium]
MSPYVRLALALPLALTVPAFAEEPPPIAPEIEEPAAEPNLEPPSGASDFVIPVEEINATAARSDRNVLVVPGNVTKITREQIDRSGARDVPELLRREAGIFVTNTTTNREGYTVEGRGFNNGGGNGSSTLVLVDGRRINEPATSNVDWSFVPLDNVESIEVVRGPASALYGDNAVAGVIQIRTRQAEPGARVILHGRTGSFDTDGGSAWVGGGAGPVTASAFYDGYQTDGYRDHSALDGERGEMNIAVDLWGRGTLGVRGGYDSNERERPGALTAEEVDEDRRQAALGSLGNFQNSRERFGQLYGDVDITEELAFHFDGHHRRRNDRLEDGNEFFSFTSEGETDANALNAHFAFDTDVFGHTSRTLLGADWLQEDIDSQSLLLQFPPFAFSDDADTSARRKLIGLFLQEEFNITEDLILSAGIRRDTARYDGARKDVIDGVPQPLQTFDHHFEEWSPKAALTYRVFDPVSVYVSYARGFRFPNVDEAFGFFGFTPELVPQTSDAYEAGVKVRTKRIALNLSYFNMDVENEIYFLVIPDVVAFNLNVDRVRHQGVELSGNVRPWDWLEIFGGYTFDNVRIQRFAESSLLKGTRMPIIPEHRGNVGFTVFLPYGFEVGGNANYVGSRPVANDLFEIADKLPRFATYDARVAWRHALPYGFAVTVEGAAYNVTNREYSEFGGISAFPPFGVGFFSSPGRNYLASLWVEYRL